MWEMSCRRNYFFLFSTAGTRRCPGQVGGGWEETDSYNNSSHNSSQDITTDSRASLGSKSADIRSASGGSRESSGDLSERLVIPVLSSCDVCLTLVT